MKRLLLIIILTFSFQTLIKADDIRDFQIEGMSIGDSLLDFFSEEEIIIKNKSYHYSSKKYYQIRIDNIYFYNDMKACLEKQKTIISEFDEKFINKKNPTSKLKKHPSDPTGKSFYTYTSYELNDGVISLECTDWSNSITSNKNWQDNLSVHIKTKKFSDWLDFKAY